MIPKINIEVLVFPGMGDISWPMAPPTGLATAMIIVAVVRPLRSNHVSLYMGPRTWNMGWAIAAKNCRRVSE